MFDPHTPLPSYPYIPPYPSCRCRVLNALFPCRTVAVSVMTMLCHVFTRNHCHAAQCLFPATPSLSIMTPPYHAVAHKTADMPHNTLSSRRTITPPPMPCHLHSPCYAIPPLMLCRSAISRHAIPLSFLHRVLSLPYHFPLIAAPPAFPLPATTHMLAYTNNQLSKRQDAFEATTQSRRRQERGCSRLYSPPKVQTSRRCRQSQSPHQQGQESPSDCHGRNTSQPARKQKFFQSSAAPCGGVCVACLSCHNYPFANCDGATLWDGSASTSKKNEQGRIVARDGLPICFDVTELSRNAYYTAMTNVSK